MKKLLTSMLVLLAALNPAAGEWAQAAATVPLTQPSSSPANGQNDFDFEIGTWTTSVRLLRNPMSGQAPDWAQYRGVSIVKGLQGGRANLVELSVSGTRGKIEGIAFRLYNPDARQWSLNYANLRNGLLTAPVYGQFNGERGVFYGQDLLDGRAVLIRFIITRISRQETHFEQAFSADGGKTWELNWYAVDTRQ